MKEIWVRFLGWEDPLEEGMATHFILFCLKNPHGQRSLVGCGPWNPKELDTPEWLSAAQSFSGEHDEKKNALTKWKIVELYNMILKTLNQIEIF